MIKTTEDGAKRQTGVKRKIAVSFRLEQRFSAPITYKPAHHHSQKAETFAQKSNPYPRVGSWYSGDDRYSAPRA